MNSKQHKFLGVQAFSAWIHTCAVRLFTEHTALWPSTAVPGGLDEAKPQGASQAEKILGKCIWLNR